MKILRMIVRSFRVLMGTWNYRRYLYYERLIRKEQEAALRGMSLSLCAEINKKHLCEHARIVHVNGGGSFYGCMHEPYYGKWIAEINDCPCGKTPQSVPNETKEALSF